MLDGKKSIAPHKGERVLSRVNKRERMFLPGFLERRKIGNLHDHVAELIWAAPEFRSGASIFQKVIPPIPGNKLQDLSLDRGEGQTRPSSDAAGLNFWPGRKKHGRTGQQTALF